jgi:hypothetical protein
LKDWSDSFEERRLRNFYLDGFFSLWTMRGLALGVPGFKIKSKS